MTEPEKEEKEEKEEKHKHTPSCLWGWYCIHRLTQDDFELKA